MERAENKKSGMTLAEVLMSVVITMLLIGIVLGMWNFAYKNWALDRIRTNLRIDLEVAMERLKYETRLSSTTYASMQKPVGGSDYTAISFPMATPDANGFFALDANGNIDWDKSVIYHVYNNPATGYKELRKTEFTDNNAILIDSAERAAQLESVVLNVNGNGSSAANGNNAVTEVIIDKISGFTVTAEAREFDGYSDELKRSDNVKFGSVRLTPGNHDFKFEVTGKNAASAGRRFGIDTLSVAPSGCQQEMEAYTPQDSSGDGSAKVGPDVLWSGNNFLEYGSNAVGDYITFRIYYDTWLEANFNNSVRTNTILTGDDLYVKLPLPEDGNETAWTAEMEAGSASGDSARADFAASLSGITVRNIVASENLELNGDLARVNFVSHSDPVSSVTIGPVYLDEISSNEDAVDPAVTTTPGTTRSQLYFTDSANNIVESITIPGNSSAYSNWAIFPIDSTRSYFITFYVSGNGFVSYWAGTAASDINSYLMGGNHASQAKWSSADPLVYLGHEVASPYADGKYTSSANIYAEASLEVWSNSGSVITEVYDTKVPDPNYNPITRDEYNPSGAGISVYGRSSDDKLMTGAAWTSGLVTGAGRYAQLKADLSATPHWTCVDHPAVQVTDLDYKNNTNIRCPTCLKLLIPAADTPWVDNIMVTWQGSTHMCDINGFFAQKPDYGIIKLTVDGDDLVKGWEFTTAVYEDFQDETYRASLSAEVEPRNTGK